MSTPLRELLDAFTRMPDAGLTENDPRYAWWYETAKIRERAREALENTRDDAAMLRQVADYLSLPKARRVTDKTIAAMIRSHLERT